MSAESTGLGAIELEPLVSLPPVPEGPEPPVPEGPEGIAEFWINMAREEILAIKRKNTRTARSGRISSGTECATSTVY